MFGVSIALMCALCTVQNPHVECTMGLATDARKVTGETDVTFLANQLAIVNMLMIIVRNQLDCAKLALTGSGEAFVSQSAVLAVPRDRVKGGRATAKNVKTAFGVEIVHNVAVHAQVQRVIR